MRLFIDTNVLIDFMGERAAYYLQAASLFSLAVFPPLPVTPLPCENIGRSS